MSSCDQSAEDDVLAPVIIMFSGDWKRKYGKQKYGNVKSDVEAFTLACITAK